MRERQAGGMEGENSLVSIVTPCYNSARFIKGCIESVLAQDYPRVEHIVQDGDSHDGTVEILRRYDGRVDWISEPDDGQADGLNRALQRCRGDIILVLNADDELLPHAASWGVKKMAEHPEAAVVYGDLFFVDEDGSPAGEFLGPDPYDYVQVLCVERVPPAQAAFVRRTHFEQVGFYADTTLPTCPDYEMWVRIGLRFPMVHMPGFITRYRCHFGSLGREKDVIDEMCETKRMVMDRLFDDPTTPQEIRMLKKRAHAGVKSWTASMLLQESSKVAGLRYACEAFLGYPGKIQGKLFTLYILRMFFPPVYRWLHRTLTKRHKVVEAAGEEGSCAC